MERKGSPLDLALIYLEAISDYNEMLKHTIHGKSQFAIRGPNAKRQTTTTNPNQSSTLRESIKCRQEKINAFYLPNLRLQNTNCK